MDKQHLLNMAKSFANQEKEVLIGKEKLNEPIVLGFQPEGIASISKDGYDLVAIADYYAPAICLVKVEKTDDGGLRFFDVEWIRAVQHGIDTPRMFTDIVRGGNANRMQTVNIRPDGKIWYSRNADPERSFFVTTPPEIKGTLWKLTNKIYLPPVDDMAMVFSALCTEDALYTTESPATITNDWRLLRYTIRGAKITVDGGETIAPFTYGIGRIGEKLLTITDFRCQGSLGINLNGALVDATEGITGNGITVLGRNNSLLISTGGQSFPGPFNGRPGSLLFKQL